MQLVLVEDNAQLAASLAAGLREERFEVDVVGSANGAIERARRRDFDLMVLDLGLPDRDGIAVLEEARGSHLHFPILVLTARDAIEARVQALEAGADDYMIKPFAFAELVARIHSLVRRASGPRWIASSELPISLHEDLIVESAGKAVQLSPREFRLLGCLVRRAGELVTRPELLDEVFGYSFDPGTNVIDVHLAHLRRKLAGFPIAIETVRGAGIRLAVVK